MTKLKTLLLALYTAATLLVHGDDPDAPHRKPAYLHAHDDALRIVSNTALGGPVISPDDIAPTIYWR